MGFRAGLVEVVQRDNADQWRNCQGQTSSCWISAGSKEALVLRVTRKLKSKGWKPGLVPVDITADDILEAEELWIRDIQIHLMSSAKFKNCEGEFGVFSDPNGILRCGGRLGNADLSESTTPKKMNPTQLRRPLQRFYPLKLWGSFTRAFNSRHPRCAYWNWACRRAAQTGSSMRSRHSRYPRCARWS